MMNADWQACLRAQGARIDGNSVRDFGDPEGELIAARDATIAAPLTRLALIECAGPDAQTFLHNQLTSDVNHLAESAAQHAAWCSPKGRMLASFVLFRRGADYLALLSDDLAEFILERLRIYVLRSKVTLADRRADCGIIGVSGPRAAAALQNAGLEAPSAALATAGFADGSVIRLDERRYIVAAAADAAARLWRELSAAAAPAGAPVWQWLDVAAGVPWIAEATREAFVPQMTGLDRIGGVSFHKGCYPGQEIVARARYLGKVKRHLYRVHAAGPVAAGAAVFPAGAPDQPCGQIAAAAAAPGGGYDALAVILEDAVGQGELRTTQADGGGVGLSNIVPVAG
ncbi:MAG: folate-binding protein [Candidatus Accumulibacter sp.]|jgi:folate-binding protein YgfZ|nr:folate-binding protein [Accumulibacter sp.]